ncbi:type II secretion system protein GspL, partial [Gammaproteobacteria bacterium AB-CW1]|nr:type II secretion system protein GspL [Gammaproteobacteria bacterium AB-CW1]
MTETLVIRFSDPADERVESFLIDGQGQRLGTPTVQNLADCAEMAEGRRVIALLPGESVTLLDAHIPTRKYQRMLQAAPWVLEDQLAQNVERLHFAIGPRQEDDRVRVAVAAHECMQALTERCQKAGLLLAGILPDFLALPRNENEWTLLIDGERVLL